MLAIAGETAGPNWPIFLKIEFLFFKFLFFKINTWHFN